MKKEKLLDEFHDLIASMVYCLGYAHTALNIQKKELESDYELLERANKAWAEKNLDEIDHVSALIITILYTKKIDHDKILKISNQWGKLSRIYHKEHCEECKNER